MIGSVIAQQVKHKNTSEEPQMESAFTIIFEEQVYKDIPVLLFEGGLEFSIQHKENPVTYTIPFEFDLIFEVLLKTNGQSKGKTATPYGLKLTRFGTPIQFNSADKETLFEWRDFLQEKLNQRGFHELFKPIRKIGKGNFASVYLVIKLEDKKKYAVKAFSKEGLYQEENGKESLINEIDLNRQLSHKNLMQIYGVFQSDNSIYVSVELLQGGQLQDKISSKHKFTPSQIKSIMKGILEGLEYMHAKNIMHRDLKPENIILREADNYDCVIADFGLSTKADEKQYLFVRCGTPGYVAPEIVNLKDLKAKYDPICDLFSLGVIFHTLALRRPPFPGSEYNEVLSQNRACKIDFGREMYQNLPPEWLDLMKRLLEKNPKKRISATEALNHDFFLKDSKFHEAVKNRDSLRLALPENCPRKSRMDKSEEKLSSECQSPLLTTNNEKRKNRRDLRDDSCLKFKMKENLPIGQGEAEGETVSEINSPLLQKKSSSNNPSRFRQACHG